MRIPVDTRVKISFKKSKKRCVREGKILAYYDKFICIWIYSKKKKSIGWRECFLITDIDTGLVSMKTEKILHL